MGLNVGSFYPANSAIKSSVDVQALARVTEQILNPNNEKTVDVSTLDLSKFNRASIGTDLYAARTNGEIALQASKAATDFGLNFSQNFNNNIQYLNSQAAQSLFTAKEANIQAAFSLETAEKVSEDKIILATSQVSETKDMNKDKRGSNPFSFYMPSEQPEEREEIDTSIFSNSINIFA